MKRMTYKELIDFCNSTPWYHCKNGECEHLKECDAYGLKYDGSIPACDDWTHPERYTDEEIVIEEVTEMSKELKTNLDRIRAMSLEELAEFLKGYDVDDAGINFCSETGECPHAKKCHESESRSGCYYVSERPVTEAQKIMWVDWLKQEWKDAPAGSGEPSEEDDLISRTAAIKEARWVNTDGGRFEVVHIETLLTLPAIKTEHVGHWINDSGPLKCSECGTSFPDLYPDYEKSVACPHCGAPIRGERDV